MITTTEIPKGFKKTNSGIIPDHWKIKHISEIGNVSSGGTPFTGNQDYWDGNINWCTPTDITALRGNKYLAVTKTRITESGLKNSSAKVLPINSLIVCTRASIGKVAINTVPMSTNQGFKNISGFKGVLVDFLYYRIMFDEQRLVRIANGSTFLEISKTDFDKFQIPLPPLSEQQKITYILSTWDQAIRSFTLLFNEKENQRKGLEQQLLSGQVRFKEYVKSEQKVKTKVGTLPIDWELKLVSDIVDKVKEKLEPEPKTLYREIGIRSHCKGIFHKEEVTGKSLGNKSVFWIQPDCFVANIVFAWEHAIAKTTEAEVGMIASHRFPLYKPKADILDLDYLLYYFKTARGKHLLGLASPGGAGRNKTLGQTEFAKLKIPVPSLEEQNRIVSVLSESDKEIELLKQHIATLKEQKKGLMQKLLTGQIRTI